MFPDGTLAVTSAGGAASRRGYRGGLSVKPVLQLKGVGKLLRSAHPTRVTISIAERDSHTPLTIVARGHGQRR